MYDLPIELLTEILVDVVLDDAIAHWDFINVSPSPSIHAAVALRSVLQYGYGLNHTASHGADPATFAKVMDLLVSCMDRWGYLRIIASRRLFRRMQGHLHGPRRHLRLGKYDVHGPPLLRLDDRRRYLANVQPCLRSIRFNISAFSILLLACWESRWIARVRFMTLRNVDLAGEDFVDCYKSGCSSLRYGFQCNAVWRAWV
ncbi:hypothetical protein CPB85DRAFT_1348617 [Mucidula mucida]|nr:hypothetical protein CPB85DRAFT_1348617 [Mucidula mucida]